MRMADAAHSGNDISGGRDGCFEWMKSRRYDQLRRGSFSRRRQPDFGGAILILQIDDPVTVRRENWIVAFEQRSGGLIFTIEPNADDRGSGPCDICIAEV